MTTLFDATTNGTPATETKDSIFKALVGETQKYKTEEDLAKAYVHADAFIEQLKEENRVLKEKQQAAATIDDVLARIQEQKASTTEAPQSLDQTAVTTLVKETVSGLMTEQAKKANLLEADKLMKEKFGDKAADVYMSKATTPELKKVLMEAAAANPKEFVKLFETVQMPSGGTIDTPTRSANIPTTGGDPSVVEGTKAWAAKIRKENPNLYYSQEFQYKLQNLVTRNPTLYFGS